MTNIPSVTIVITCFNYENYVQDAIKSALNQTFKNIEIIVINDGSQDKSNDKILEIKTTNNFKYINQVNKGVIFARNKGIKLTKSDYLLFLDADDILEPDYVEKCVDTAIRESADVVYTNYSKFGLDQETSDFPDFNIEILKNMNFIHVSSLIKRTSIGQQKFDTHLANMSHEDWDFFLGLALNNNKFVLCKSTTLRYRIHGKEGKSRNNLHDSFDDKSKYAYIYKYVINKYRKLYPNEMEYLSGLKFSDWSSFLFKQNSELNKHTNNLNNDYKELTLSYHKLEQKFHNTIDYKIHRLMQKTTSFLNKTRR